MRRAVWLAGVSVVLFSTVAWLGSALGSDPEDLPGMAFASASAEGGNDAATTTLLPAFGVSPTVTPEVAPPVGGGSANSPAIDGAAAQGAPLAAAPTSETTKSPGGKLRARIDRAMALIPLDWQRLLPGWTLEFLGPRSSVQGLTYTTERRIEVFVRSDVSDAQLAHVIAHELGHAIDVTYLSAESRRAVNVARGRAADFPWWVAPGSTDFASGAGDWAECFSYTLVGPQGGFRSQIGEPPTPLQQELIRQLTGI